MGITGVEGVFRRCCEETLSVMRTNKEALLTIVEVHCRRACIEFTSILLFQSLERLWAIGAGFHPRPAVQVGSLSFEGPTTSKGIGAVSEYSVYS